MDIGRILVPLDGSTFAEAALAKATELAKKDATTLVLLRAAEAHAVGPVDPVEAQVAVVREAEDYLAGVAASLRARGFEKVETSVWYGGAPTVIVEAASFLKPDLIVMNTHGRSGIGRLIMGSVAESVLRGTTTPILLVRAAAAPVERPRDGGVAERVTPRMEAHR